MNRLADETSPYLRQHRDNPVDWYPWGDEAFAAARERNVPVLLSVGYSACHWCHVMAHECFEDDEVAARMNELFVNVKVDREERPDVDQLYMDAVQALTGRGGWPMTVFLTPDAKPFYGGTYYPRDSFLKLLDAVDDAYRNKPAELEQNTNLLMKAIEKTADLSPAGDLPTVEQMNTSVQTLARAFDQEWGGFGKAPKFPSTFHIELILRAYMTSGSEAAKTVITTTLDAMAAGGIYDHVGGGFARYSTDREWLVPHFEKMLSDQALLVQTYLHALVVLREPQWRLVVQDTIEYVLNTLTHEEGGFFSAEDADSPDADGNGVGGPVLHVDPRRGPRCARQGAARHRRHDPRVLGHHRRRQLRHAGRTPQHPEPGPPPRRSGAPRRDHLRPPPDGRGARRTDPDPGSTTR